MLALVFPGAAGSGFAELRYHPAPLFGFEDRARQAYARAPALSRSIAAMNASNLDEAFKQLGYFHPQVGNAIQLGTESG